jgi:hypothetical protein
VVVAVNPHRSIKQLAMHHQIDPRTMRNLVKEDLRLESHVVIKRTLLTPNAQETRKESCQKLINKLKASQPHQVQIFFMKKSLLWAWLATANSPYLTDLPVADLDPCVCISPKSQAPLKQMVLWVVGSDSQKMSRYFHWRLLMG